LVLWVQSCSGTSKSTQYKNYLAKVGQLASVSNRFGTSLATAIQTPSIKPAQLADKMDSLAQQQQVDLQAANRIKPPSSLSPEHRSLVEALQFRVDGLRGLASALRSGAGSTKVSETATSLTGEAQLLVAGDVVWEQDFRAPTQS